MKRRNGEGGFGAEGRKYTRDSRIETMWGDLRQQSDMAFDLVFQ